MESPPPEPAPIYLQLREYILNLAPQELGLTSPSSKKQVWGVLMETGYEVGSATLVALFDGTTSLYYSTGGGMLGSPDYAPIASSAKAMVALAGSFVSKISPAEKIDLPSVGQVSFTLLTFSDKYTSSAPEELLVSGDHALSPLYQSGREIINHLRVLKDKKRT
jgi:hypothetical protein